MARKAASDLELSERKLLRETVRNIPTGRHGLLSAMIRAQVNRYKKVYQEKHKRKSRRSLKP